MIKLYVMNGVQQGQSYDLQGETITLGRAPENDIQIKDDHISRKHLKIVRKGKRFFIVDLGSKNGTLLNGEKVVPGKECEIREGDPISLGKTLVVIGEGLPGEEKPALDSANITTELDAAQIRIPAQDRPMTHFKNMELLYKVSTVLMDSLNITEILDRVMDSLFDLLNVN
jgi:pSer/pThr/pTyr-binding forkhead associated (FHA) protein